MKSLTPKEIVKELDKYIIGQHEAKRNVAIALRNRWRRQQVKSDLRNEIIPNNIILIGPTGTGKTEISRRLADLAQAPFIKVEATKFTEIGYVGRDVDSIIRDLVEVAIKKVKDIKRETVKESAIQRAEERILDILLPPIRNNGPVNYDHESEADPIQNKYNTAREELRRQFKEKLLSNRMIEMDVHYKSVNMQVMAPIGLDDIGSNLQDMLNSMVPEKKKKKKMTVEQAFDSLVNEETDSLLDHDQIIQLALETVENNGIVFIDEIDKIAGNSDRKSSADISREGVQRDLLPVVEGTTVNTKHGAVKTDHILFIASGAFHVSKPSDLIPEFQGRFPIRVELKSLTKDDFIRILKEPENALIKQYQAMLNSENYRIDFDDSAIEEIAELASLVNLKNENIGARRLHTILSKLMEEFMFEIPDYKITEILITRETVKNKLNHIINDEDLSQYIL